MMRVDAELIAKLRREYEAGTALAPTNLVGKRHVWTFSNEFRGRGLSRRLWAYDEDFRTALVKLLISDDPELRPHFEEELVVLGKLSHPNTLPILDHGLFEGRPFLVMEHAMPGVVVDGLYESKPAARTKWATQWMAGALRGLAAGHEVGLVLGYMQPQDMLMGDDGLAKLCEWGFRYVDNGVELVPLLTGIDGYPLSPYDPPERHASGRISPETDVYTAAICLACFAQAAPPEPGDTVAKIIAPVDERLRPILRRATAEDPAKRPSAAEVADELEAILPTLSD